MAHVTVAANPPEALRGLQQRRAFWAEVPRRPRPWVSCKCVKPYGREQPRDALGALEHGGEPPVAQALKVLGREVMGEEEGELVEQQAGEFLAHGDAQGLSYYADASITKRLSFDESRLVRRRHLLRRTLPRQCSRGFLVHPRTNHRGDQLGDQRPATQSEQIGLAQRLAHRRVPRAGALVRPDEHVAQQLDAIQLVDGEHAVDIGTLRNVHEGQRAEVPADQRNVCREAGYALVDVLETPQIGNVHEREEGPSKGSAIAAAVSRIVSKHSSMSCGTSSGW